MVQSPWSDAFLDWLVAVWEQNIQLFQLTSNSLHWFFGIQRIKKIWHQMTIKYHCSFLFLLRQWTASIFILSFHVGTRGTLPTFKNHTDRFYEMIFKTFEISQHRSQTMLKKFVGFGVSHLSIGYLNWHKQLPLGPQSCLYAFQFPPISQISFIFHSNLNKFILKRYNAFIPYSVW